jgi:uncharacterized protein
MKILISGGTGFIGTRLAESLQRDGHSVVIPTRNPHREKKSTQSIKYLYWDSSDPQKLVLAMNECDAVVNLVGESIASKRWTPAQKKKILDSRVSATRSIVSAISKAENKPSVMVSASGIHIHDHTIDTIYNESSEPGNDFLANVCLTWESEAKKVEDENVRLAIVRFGIVLGETGGALQRMLLPFKLFAGGPLGSGKQWMPWVHIDDVIGIVRFAIENQHVTGPLNATSPNQLTNKEFSNLLGSVLQRPSFLPAPAFALRLVLGEMADTLLLSGQRVMPERTRELGYSFKYPDLEEALRDILKK